jgi:ubiquinone/menaquinone biosynthesis C-methylase UbiE
LPYNFPMNADPKKIEEEFNDSGGLNLRNELQEAHGTHPRGWFKWLFDRMHPIPGQRILDLGCGTGQYWIENRSRLWEDWFIVLGDRSLAMMQEAARKISPIHSRTLSLMVDAHQLPFPHGSFDTVLAVGLFDILPDPERSFAEVHRVLGPGGRIYATAGGFRHLEEFEQLLQPVLPEARLGGLPDRFGLENGIQRLLPWFDQLTLHRYADRLIFREVQPVLDYLLSEDGIAAELQGERLVTLVEKIEQRLKTGAFMVKRDKGVIIGERRPAPLDI